MEILLAFGKSGEDILRQSFGIEGKSSRLHESRDVGWGGYFWLRRKLKNLF